MIQKNWRSARRTHNTRLCILAKAGVLTHHGCIKTWTWTCHRGCGLDHYPRVMETGPLLYLLWWFFCCYFAFNIKLFKSYKVSNWSELVSSVNWFKGISVCEESMKNIFATVPPPTPRARKYAYACRYSKKSEWLNGVFNLIYCMFTQKN